MKRTSCSALWTLLGLVTLAALPAQTQTSVVISEFMAQNETGLADDTGQRSDWIELYNAGAAPVDLAGWRLTDTTKDLAKWQFPSRILAPRSFLLVYASGESQTNAGVPLHASFRLDNDREYLALVRPDGTIACQYTPKYPSQRPDISYGLGMLPGPLTFLVPEGAPARFLVPSADGGLSWTQPGFDDSAWAQGPTGLGFDLGTNYAAGLATDLFSAMYGLNASAYVRIGFEALDPAAFQELRLRLRYDDGVVVYLNGAEVFRTNAPPVVAWNSGATAAHGNDPADPASTNTAPSGLPAAQEINLTGYLPFLRAGSNVLAIQGLNLGPTNADFLILPELSARAFIVQETNSIYFVQATPGALNSDGSAELAPKVAFSPAGGTMTSNLVVTLSSPLTNAVIHYTLDGSAPDERSPLYTLPLSVTNSASLRAKAYALGWHPSSTATESYTLIEPELLSFSSELPLVILDTFGRNVTPDMAAKAPATLTLFDTSRLTGRAALAARPSFQSRVAVEGRGQTSWSGFEDGSSPHPGIQKRPYNIELIDDNDNDNPAAILDFPAGSDFVLLNVYNDKSFLNDFMAYELAEKMGRYQVRRRFVEVFWNGTPPEGTADRSGKVGTNDYAGIYLLLEKIRVGPNRVNIAPLAPEDSTEPAITGGYIFKKDKNSPGDVNFGTPSQPPLDTDALKYHDPRGDQLTAAQKFWLANHLTNFEAVLYGPEWRDPVLGYSRYIDVDSFVDFHWIVEYSKQIDGYRLSSYFNKDRGGKIHWAPIWDWNLSFGNANYAQGGLTNGWYWPLISAQQHIWERRLIAEPGDPDYQQRLVDRWGQLRQDVFHPSNVLARVDAITNLLSEAVARDYARWPRLGRYLWPNPALTGDGRDVDYVSPTTYSGIIQQWKKYIVMRTAWIDSQYLRPPVLSRSGGWPAAPLGMLAPTGMIYYTLDGSDPRLPGGYISPYASRYTNFVTLPGAALVCARAWLTNAWSPPVSALFADPVPRLAVTEIMYHPDNPGGTVYGAGEFEYIEFMNTSGSEVDLTGMRLDGGADFVFPPGELVPAGASTVQDFDNPGTTYTPAKLGAGPGASVQSGGPSNAFLRLAAQDTGTNRNRIAFDQTLSGAYDQMTAEFDFRAQNTTYIPPITYGPPTLQDFYTPGTPYSIYPTTGTSTPLVTAADAGSQGTFMRLTADAASLASAVYFDRNDASVYSLVTATFDFRVASASTPADGMGFVFLNTATYGTNGIGTGMTSISESPNFANALGVGFDIYNNNTPPSEPNDNHVSIHWNNAQVSATPATPSFRLAAGVFHRAQITIRFDSGNALISVILTPNVYAGGAAQTLYDRFLIPGVTPFNGRVAIGARTGGSSAAQDIDNVNVQYGNSLFPPPAGFSLAWLPASRFGTSGAGTTLSNYTDLPALTNTFALNADLHLLSEINNLNLYYNGAARTNAYLAPALLDLDNGLFHHAKIVLDGSPDGAIATLTITPDIFGTPGAPIVVFSNYLVAGFYPGDCRIELAGRSGGQNINLDFDNLVASWEKHLPNPLAAGARVLLVKNRAAFEARYGTGLPVAGQFVGELDNNGGHLALYGRYGEPLLDFHYNDTWIPVTDGLGFSLVAANPAAPASTWDSAAAWIASSTASGSPGTADPAPMVLPPVRVNEVLSHPDTNADPAALDAIELFNPSADTAVDISYWFLSDDFNLPKKFQLPSPSILAPGGFLVLTETNFGAAFALNAAGDDVWLFSADASGRLTGYAHGFNFGAAAPGVTFGRHVTSQGLEKFVAQTTPTLGSTNSGPLAGPLVLTEVYYHPPVLPDGADNTLLEFVEVLNTSSQAVLLHDPAIPGWSWRLRGGIDFHFPEGATLAPGARALAASFDPLLDPDLAAAFRAALNLDPAAIVFGPFSGKLNNDHDTVELARPVLTGATNSAPDYALVDKLEYHGAPPWPLAADGPGFSLQRRDTSAYGNDPANWTAGAPSPAGAPAIGVPPVLLSGPSNVTAAASTPVSLQAAAEGPGPLSYQWRFNGLNLPGATNPVLAFASVQVSNSGRYQVVVMNPSAAAESLPALLEVWQGVSILLAPTNRSAWPGSNTTFTVLGTGNGPVTYQWRVNGANIDGATNTTLSLSNLAPAQAGDYTAVVSDPLGPVAAPPARLTILLSPVFTVQPANKAVLLSNNITFTATAVSSTPVRYQWRFNGANIPWAVSSSLTLTNAQLPQSGLYSVVATDNYGSTLSSNATLVVSVKPVFLTQPAHVTGLLGDPATLTATASGTLPMYARWIRNGSEFSPYALLPADTATLVLSNLQPAHGGAFRVALTNPAIVSPAGVGSGSAYVTVVQPPAAPSVAPGGSITLKTTAYGQSPVRIAWEYNGAPLSDATLVTTSYTNVSSLSLSNAQAAQEGQYTVWVTNAASQAASFTFNLRVVEPPHPALILAHPTNLVVDPGASALFTVTATGDAPLAFQWWFNDTNRLDTQTNATLALESAQPVHAGLYKVVVSNASGAASSTNAHLWISTLDTDGDGLKDWQEYLAGTDPLDPQSTLSIALVPGTGVTNPPILRFTAIANHVYTVVYSDTPAGQPLTVLTNVPAMVGNTQITVSDTNPPVPARFYRVGTPARQ